MTVYIVDWGFDEVVLACSFRYSSPSLKRGSVQRRQTQTQDRKNNRLNLTLSSWLSCCLETLIGLNLKC